ncbi:hypothetical protein [Shivajiella indica]|uniref:T9SS type A sorting domain-containing protein n=1 Tax=Shivajiella indica TaxID=872115 RepID=A0ABW5BH78_9BACT
MRFFTFILFSLLLLFGVAVKGYGQVIYYTSNGTCDSNNPNYFSDGSCWDLSGTCSSSLFPPLTTTTSNCTIIIDVNHEINIGSLTISATNLIRINVNLGVNLNLSGNLNINKGSNFRIFTYDGGKFNIGGSMNIGTGTGNALAVIRIGGNTVGGAGVYTNALDLQNSSNLQIDEGGVLVVDGPTTFAANNISIRNAGLFRTRTLDVRGQATVENFGSGVMVIDEDLIIRGNSGLTVKGNSEVEVGGNIDFDGNNGTLDVEEFGSVRVCGDGNLPPESGGNVTVERPTATYEIGNCRILPVEYVYVEARFLRQSRSSVIRWATAKEWESSHFEIERAVTGLEFIKIGEVKAAGWSESAIEYEFEDSNLPLTGGNILYRLKQVDLNGTYSFSSVMSVRASSIEFTNGVWRAYPNPTDGNSLRINLMDASQYNQEPLTFRLIHPMIQTQPMTVGSENEMNEELADLSRKMPKGVFVVEIQWGQKVEHIKILKQ